MHTNTSIAEEFDKPLGNTKLICSAKGAEAVEMLCCSQTPAFTVINQQSSACSCSPQWSELKTICLCPKDSHYLAGQCRTAKQITDIEVNDELVQYLERPFYLWFTPYTQDQNISKIASRNHLLYKIIDTSGERIIDANSATFSYQKNSDGSFFLDLNITGLLDNSRLDRSIFSNTIASDLALRVSPCKPGPDLSSQNIYYIAVSGIHFSSSTSDKKTKHSLSNMANIFSDSSHQRSGKNHECLSMSLTHHGYLNQ